jgi:Pyridoxamine 5'-phosphate oxidase
MTDADTVNDGVQLDPATAEFIAGTTSIAVATRDAQFMPAVGKALGCSVGADRCTVTVFVDREQSARVAADLAAGSSIAVVFSYPATHQTVQIKGARAAVAPASAAQRVRARTQIDAIVEHLAVLGYDEQGLRMFFNFTPAALLAVTFAPTAVFAQTPGPRAGERIAG